jgi:hypothetical protein
MTNIRTAMKEIRGAYNCGSGACDRDYGYGISYSLTLDPSATLKTIVLKVTDRTRPGHTSQGLQTYVITNFTYNVIPAPYQSDTPINGYLHFFAMGGELTEYLDFDNQTYEMIITDSNGYSTTYTGTYTNSETDFQ